MFRIKVFVKLGGSFITDKVVPESLNPARVTAAARMIRKALEQSARRGQPISLVLGHGAGSYGHIHAVKYDAVHGVHPQYGWEGFYKIRESMTRMNQAFVKCCNEGGLYPVTVSPFAVACAKNGAVRDFDVRRISELLEGGQVPLIHGDIVLDSKRGFTIASTETLLAAMTRRIRFDRIVMVSDTDGVLDSDGATIPRIDRRRIRKLGKVLGGSGAPDVTGGMRRKVEELFSLVSGKRAKEARILRCAENPEKLSQAILGDSPCGTLLKV